MACLTNNGHAGIAELCDICPVNQLALCRSAHRVPTVAQLHEVAASVPEGRGLVVEDISSRAVVVSGLPDEQPRYYLQHAVGFQVHDAAHPHHPRQHGRAAIGWEGAHDD